MERARKQRAIVVGGSIAGVCSAHALIAAGWDVTVVEKSLSPPDGIPTGAGLGLDPQSIDFLSRWLPDPDVLLHTTLPLAVDVNRVTDSETKRNLTLVRDDQFGFRAAHWADLYLILYKALPPGIVLWGHQFLLLKISEDNSSVGIKAVVLETEEIVELWGDLLVAADGCLSAIRRHFLPNFKLRYSGYSAWRGVLDFSDNESSDTIRGLRRAYPELGTGIYFDLADRTHTVLYELKSKRINWIWYTNILEPEQKGSSVTMKVSDDMLDKMQKEAEIVWVPELAKVIRETKDPFINIIYDSDPLPQLVWRNVVLVGDAAHPTTPHGLRSTNMSILDAGVLGLCLEKLGIGNLGLALKEFENIRIPIISQQVLHARRLGRIKQGLTFDENRVFNPMTATSKECLLLQQRQMPFFSGVPVSI